MAKNGLMEQLVFVLVLAGGLNWLGVAFGFNLVESVVGPDDSEGKLFGSLANVVYLLVGLATVMFATNHWGHHMG